jgi:hypothetical protein
VQGSRIFLCYRRRDAGGYARAICDQLIRRFEGDRVFLDVQTIEGGQPWDETIKRAVAASDVLVVLIGPDWLIDREGVRRLDEQNDPVRREIMTALDRDVPIVPVLLQGAVMPEESALPEHIQMLTRKQAIDVTDSDWDRSMERVIAAVERFLMSGSGPGEAPPPPPPPPPPAAPPVASVPTYMPHAILATVFCCLPTGVYAIVQASRVKPKLQAGDLAGAAAASNQAKIWSIVSAAIGAAIVIIYIIVYASSSGA